MSLALFVQTIVNGVFIGLLLGLAATGLTLIFGVMNIGNFAAGEMILLGCYALFWMVSLYALDPLLSFPLIVLIGAALGVVVYYSLIKTTIRIGGSFTVMLVLFGLSSVMSNSFLLAWTANTWSIALDYPTLEIGTIFMPGNKILASAFAVVTSILLLVMLKWTYFGRAIRSTVADWRGATLMGVNVERIYVYGFVLGVIITVFSGSLIGLVYPFEPYAGLSYALYAFSIVILGTCGNPVGSMVAGLIIGLAISFTGSYWTQGMSPAVAYTILVITFLLKPEGLFGKRK